MISMKKNSAYETVVKVPSTLRLADVLEFATWYVYSPISCGLVVTKTSRRTAPTSSLLTLSLKSTEWPSLSHLPSEEGLATSHSRTAVWDSATVTSWSGLFIAPPSVKRNHEAISVHQLNTYLTNGENHT